jgi:Icc protein
LQSPLDLVSQDEETSLPAVRIAQVSDAHLSPSRPFFAANFARIAQVIRDERPDIVLATGDLSLAGADDDTELGHAMREHVSIGGDLLCVPGNHDVGNEASIGRNVVTSDRITRWRRVVGPSTWIRDLPGWRLIGLDAQSLESDEVACAEVERGLKDAGARSIALVQHKPIFANASDDAKGSYWSIAAAARARLQLAFRHRRPALVISGHLHQWRDLRVEDTRYIWAPSTAFVLGDAYQPTYGNKLVGWVEHLFHADGTHDARVQAPDGLRLDDLGLMPNVYRPLPRLDEQPDLWKVT